MMCSLGLVLFHLKMVKLILLCKSTYKKDMQSSLIIFIPASNPTLICLDNGTHMCGTIHKNRKYYPSELRHITLKHLEYKFATYKLFTGGIWHDWRDVTFLSTLQCFHCNCGKTSNVRERKRTYLMPNTDC